MAFKNLTDLLKEDLLKVETALRENFKSDIELIPTIGNYISNGGGKRIRPMLVLASSKICGYNNGNRHITYACIVEFLHIATLLHDDVLDEATVRRGNSTVNLKWGNEASILVGDFLFSKSFTLLAEDNEERIFKAMAYTTKELTEGQVMQLINAGNLAIGEGKYLELIKRKTATLLSVSCQIGAILGKVTPSEEEAFTSFGLNLGMAFQIIDDLLDYFGNEARLGKETGNDLNERNITLPLIHLFETTSNQQTKEFLKETINKTEISKDDLKKIKNLMEENKTPEYVKSKAKAYIDNAKNDLKTFENSPYYNTLTSMSDYLLKRDL